MKLLDGYKLVELTEDRIVQEKPIGETGVFRVIGNPNPPEEARQKCINAAAEILLAGYRRSQSAEYKKTGT